jgi:hypothetical protein
MKTKDIQQNVTFKAAIHDVYEALMDSRKHAVYLSRQACKLASCPACFLGSERITTGYFTVSTGLNWISNNRRG